MKHKRIIATLLVIVTVFFAFTACTKNCTSTTELSANEVCELSKKFVGEIITYNKKGTKLAIGTGFVYSSDGKIVTNYHVIEDAYSATITINRKKYTLRSVLAYDKNIDLAVLKINAKDLDVPEICDRAHSVGETVYAFGCMGTTSTFSMGTIIADDMEIDDVHYVQHDAVISNNNSSGPLFNQRGEIIGINTIPEEYQDLNCAISVRELSNLKYNKALTIPEFYKKECDAFIKMRNYAIQEGWYDRHYNEYKLQLGCEYTSDYLIRCSRILYYSAGQNQIHLTLLFDDEIMFILYIDEADGDYPWALIDSDFYMKGRVSASTFKQNSLLRYTSDNLPSSSRNSFRELASSMAKYLILTMYDDLAPIGVKPENLGFVNF